MMPGMFALATDLSYYLAWPLILKIESSWVLEEYEIVKTRLEKYICHPDWIVVESFADWTWQELIWHEIDFLYIDGLFV